MSELKTRTTIITVFQLILILLILGCSEKDYNKSESNMETIIVNLANDSYDEYIGRRTEYRIHMLSQGIKPGEIGWLGNPHPIGWCDICGEYHTRSECVRKFKEDFYKKIDNDSEFKKAVLSLTGKRLGCFCKPEECHGDVIKEWIESQ